MVSAKVVLLPKSCWFNSWTSINLYRWKFKSSCNIHRTVVSDNLRACAWRTADRHGLCSTAFHTASVFSGVLTIRADPPCFFFIAQAAVWKVCTQRNIMFRDGILPWCATLKCRWNFLCVTVTDSLFLKNISMTNAWCWGPHCSMATESAKPYTSNATLPWQLDAPPSYTSRSKNVGFHWRTLYNGVCNFMYIPLLITERTFIFNLPAIFNIKMCHQYTFHIIY